MCIDGRLVIKLITLHILGYGLTMYKTFIHADEMCFLYLVLFYCGLIREYLNLLSDTSHLRQFRFPIVPSRFLIAQNDASSVNTN